MEVNGKEIAIEEHGDGDAVVMVHGLGGTGNSWYPQVGPLARFFRVVRLDLEGSGRSPATGSLSIASFAADVTAAMDELDIPTAHLCGHSMGTIVCQHIAAEHPERVKSLALLGPLAEPPEPARQAIRDRAAVARKNGMVPIADTLVEVAISAETRSHQPAAAAFVREILMRQDAEGYARTCEALADARSADLASIRCPTLLVTGDEDGVSPPPAVKSLSSRISGSRVAVLPGCGHWTPNREADPGQRRASQLLFQFRLGRPVAQRKPGKPGTARPRASAVKARPASAKQAARGGRTARSSGDAPATFYICRSCVWSESARERDGKRQGTFLLEAVRDLIEADPLPVALNLRAVYCLNGCKSPCNVGFRSAGKHHVRFSHLTPDNAADVIAYARAYQANATGEVSEDETPAAMRSKMTVCTPPIG